MENFVKNLTNLVKVKTIVTLMVLVVFVILALRGDIPPDDVMAIMFTVMAFYFGTQHEKNVSKSDTAPANTEPTGTVAPETQYIPQSVDQATANDIHPPDGDTVVTGFAG